MSIDLSPGVGEAFEAPSGEPIDPTRRNFLRGAAAAGVATAVGGSVLLDTFVQPAAAESADPVSEFDQLLADHPELAELAEAAPEEVEHGEEEHHGPTLVDWVGAANFALGVRDLLPGGKGHIDSTRYGALGTLLAIKYNQSDEVGQEHLREEFKSVAMSGTIIEGTILASEALKLDFADAYRSITDEDIDSRDAIPLLTMFAAGTSPTLTTVGSAGILSKQSQTLAHQLGTVRSEAVDAGVESLGVDKDKKQEVYRILTAHVSNLSGFVLFGDPPFIAMAEKYGLPKALEYQMQACLPLAVQSLYAANQKLQRIRLEAEGVTGFELAKRSREEAITGMWRNKGILAQMYASSFANFAKVATFHKSGQMDKGIQFDFGGMIRDKVEGVMKLAFAEHIEPHEPHEGTGSRTTDFDPLERTEATSLALKLIGDAGEGEDGEHVHRVRTLVNELAYLVDDGDYTELREFLAGHGMDEAEIDAEVQRLEALERFKEHYEFSGIDEEDIARRGLLGRIGNAISGPQRLFRRMTHQDRVKNALGHASADVLNVFPFQALSVPFLIPIFQSAIDKASTALESAIPEDQRFAGLDAERLRELAVANMTAMMIAAKSGFADNYVAAKIGLELMPDKPSYPLIAAITGGRLTAIGNMANPTLVPFAEYDMGDSLKKLPKALPSVLHNLVWANVLELGKNMPAFPTPPTPKN